MCEVKVSEESYLLSSFFNDSKYCVLYNVILCRCEWKGVDDIIFWVCVCGWSYKLRDD